MIILASKSERRKELFKEIMNNYKIEDSKIDETVIKDRNKYKCLKLAFLKANYVYNNIDNKNKDNIVFGFDTIVLYKNEILEKPIDYEDAFNMLKKLSGSKHYVYTGVCIICDEFIKKFIVKSTVYFKKINDEDIIYYINNFNPYDKAGSYGIQDSNFVLKFKGDYNNVVGLPLIKLKKELKKNKYKKYFAT